MGDVVVPEDADDWPFEAKAAAISERNVVEDIREEIDGIAGIPDPRWTQVDLDAGSFTKYELVIVLLALGGPDVG